MLWQQMHMRVSSSTFPPTDSITNASETGTHPVHSALETLAEQVASWSLSARSLCKEVMWQSRCVPEPAKAYQNLMRIAIWHAVHDSGCAGLFCTGYTDGRPATIATPSVMNDSTPWMGGRLDFDAAMTPAEGYCCDRMPACQAIKFAFPFRALPSISIDCMGYIQMRVEFQFDHVCKSHPSCVLLHDQRD